MKIVAVGCVILCAVALVSAMGKPGAKAAITNYNWVDTIVRNGYDSFYGAYVTAYEEGTSAVLVVNVFSDYLYYGVQLNVSAVIVGFDWGTNYTSNECSVDNPFVVPSYQSHVFTINFTVPSVLVASNLVTHGYTIYVEHVNSTSGDKGRVGTWTFGGSGFAIFSSDQADAYNYKAQIDAYPTTSTYGLPPLTAEARELMLQSNVAKTMGTDYYNRGDFSNAKAQYKNSLNFIQQAWSNETERWSTVEDALVGLLNGGGGLLTFQGYAWLLFGIGFLFMGIGALVFLARRRPQPRASPQPP